MKIKTAVTSKFYISLQSLPAMCPEYMVRQNTVIVNTFDPQNRKKNEGHDSQEAPPPLYLSVKYQHLVLQRKSFVVSQEKTPV